MNNFKLKLKGSLLILAGLFLVLATGCQSEDDPTVLNLSESSIHCDWNFLEKPVMVTTNAEWKASSDQTWCRLSTDNGRTSQSVSILVEPFDAKGTSRHAVVTFETVTGKKIVQTIIVEQHGENTWNPSN